MGITNAVKSDKFYGLFFRKAVQFYKNRLRRLKTAAAVVYLILGESPQKLNSQTVP